MNDAITVQQTLHGYADGHQLLASSIDLDRAGSSKLLVMSDLSGPSFRDGYDTYLTGYSLGDGFYAIARTWMAPELPRPGCVWTQTLLIKDEDIARVRTFGSLLGLFRRPDSDEFFAYSQPIVWFPSLDTSHVENSSQARAILKGLYATDRLVTVPSKESQSCEATLLAVLDQQWPRLRRSFRFCSGALSLKETNFDIVVSPTEVAYSLGENAFVAMQATDEPEAWIKVALDDLCLGEPTSEFRQFLWAFGPDFRDGRAAFRHLAEIFFLLKEEGGAALARKLLSLVAGEFPSAKDGKRIKAAIFGGDGQFLSKIGGEEVALGLLISDDRGSAIDPKIADIEARARELAQLFPDDANRLAIEASGLGTANAQSYLEGFIGSLDWENNGSKGLSGALIPHILGRSPGLLANPALWQRLVTPNTISQVTTHLRRNPNELPGAVGAIIAGKSWWALHAIVAQFGPAALSVALNYIETESGKLSYDEEFGQILTSDTYALSDVLWENRAGPRSLKYLSAFLDPQWHYVRRLGAGVWADAADHPSTFSRKKLVEKSAVFFLVLGLTLRESKAQYLVHQSFDVTFSTVSSGALDDATWKKLDSALSYFPGRERLPKLIRTVARAFRDNDWLPETFMATFRSPDALSRAVVELQDSRAGRDYLASIGQSIAGGVATVSNEQAAIADKVWPKSRRKR